MPDYQAKLSVNGSQAAAIGRLVYHTKGKYPILFEPVSRVNLCETSGPNYIEVPVGRVTTQLKALRDSGLFTIAEGGFDDQPTVTAVELTPDFLVKFTFDLAVILTADVEPANIITIEKQNGEAWDTLALVDATIEHDGDTATTTKSLAILGAGVGEGLADGDVLRFTVGPDIAYFMHATKGYCALPEDPFTPAALDVVATPVANPVAGEVLVGSTVAITCATPSAVIYYTTDGGTPDEDSDEYTDPIVISGAMTIKAIATKAGMNNSDMMGAAYTVSTVATPVPTPGAGAVLDNSTISLACATGGSTIYYTTNGDTPTALSTEYTVPITVTDAFTLKAIGIKATFVDSAVLEAAYTIAQVGTPSANPVSGAVLDNSTVTLTCATNGATMYYTTNGDTPDSGDTEYTVPITITDAVTLKAIAVKTNMVDSGIMTEAYTIAQVATPAADVAAGEIADNTPVTLTCATAGATMYYTTNGDTPDAGDTEYTVPVVITDPCTLKVIAIKTNMTDSAVLSVAYTIAA